MKYLVSIDPGSSGTGIAIWSESQANSVGWDLVFVEAKTFMTDYDYVVWLRLQLLNNIPSQAVAQGDVSAYIEQPCLMSSEKGLVAAKSGALVRLSIFAGLLAGVLMVGGIPVHWIPVNKWKGNLPKHITKDRVLSTTWVNAQKEKPSHYYDAIGIGMHVIRGLVKEKSR